jgi:hypothetical protein
VKNFKEYAKDAFEKHRVTVVHRFSTLGFGITFINVRRKEALELIYFICLFLSVCFFLPCSYPLSYQDEWLFKEMNRDDFLISRFLLARVYKYDKVCQCSSEDGSDCGIGF